MPKLFKFSYGSVRAYDKQCVVVMADDVDEARRLLHAAIHDVIRYGSSDSDAGVWSITRVTEDTEVVTEIDGPVAFTYGVDG